MPEDDPADLERYWQRLRGPRPEPPPEGPPLRTAFDQFRAECEVRLAGDLWASAVITASEIGGTATYGPRLQVTDKGPVENGGINIHCIFPQSNTEFEVRGIAIWESPVAVQPLAVANFEPARILPGDGMDIHVRITL